MKLFKGYNNHAAYLDPVILPLCFKVHIQIYEEYRRRVLTRYCQYISSLVI